MLELMLQNRSPDFNTRCDCKFASSVMYLSCSTLAPLAIGAHEEGAEILLFRRKRRAQMRNEGVVFVPGAAGHGDQLKLAYQRADVDSRPLRRTRADGGMHRRGRRCRQLRPLGHILRVRAA